MSILHLPRSQGAPMASRAQFPAQLKGTTTSAGPRAAPATWHRQGTACAAWRDSMSFNSSAVIFQVDDLNDELIKYTVSNFVRNFFSFF